MAVVKWKGNPQINSYEAIQESLDLPIGMAEVLFDYNNYADEEFTDARTIAERIQEFCKTLSEELLELGHSYTLRALL